MDQFAPMQLGGQQASPGLWELLQQQQQQQQQQHHSHQQGSLPSGTPPTQPSFLHQGVLSGKPLSAVMGPGPLQVPTAPAGPDRPAQVGYHRPSAHAALGVGAAAGLPPAQPVAAQQHATALPLSGAALAAAAHLPPPAAQLAPHAGMALSHVPQQPGAAPLGPAGTFPAQHGQQAQQGGLPVGSASPGVVPTHLSIPLVATAARAQPGLGGSGGGTLGDDSHLPASSPNSINRSPPGAAGSGGEPSGGSAGGSGGGGGGGGLAKSRYRGVSYDRKKGKWRVQIKVAALGKSGVSVGYFDTEEAAARAYDRAAIGLLGRDHPNLQTNFNAEDYAGEAIPRLSGKTREEVKTTLKSERIKQAPRRRFTTRQRTSRFMGVGSSNRKNQWQARILVHGKVTHLGYYETEEEAARVYDRVSLALHGEHAQTNFPAGEYGADDLAQFRGLEREDLQRALGVKPMDKSSRFRGVSKKKGKWEAKVMVNRRWAYRELFDSEEEAARAYDRALWRLKPKEARSYVNFKDQVPAEVADMLARGEDLPAAAAGGGQYHSRRGGHMDSSDEEEASASEDDNMAGSEEEDAEYGSGEVAPGHAGSPAGTSTRPRRAAAMHHHNTRAARGSPAKAAAAAAAPARAAPHASAAAAALQAAHQAQQAAALPAAAGTVPQDGGAAAAAAWSLAPQGSGTTPALQAGLRSSGSAPNLMALAGASGFGAAAAQQAGFAAGSMHMGLGGFAAAPGGQGVSQHQFSAGAPRVHFFDGASGSAELGASAGPSPLAGGSFGLLQQAQHASALGAAGTAGAAPALDQRPLLIRVGSETHLIPHAQQHLPLAAPRAQQAQQAQQQRSGGSTLGKRISRIQSEPHFPTMLDAGDAGEPLLPAGGSTGVESLMNDRDLFKSMGVGDFNAMHDAGGESDMVLDSAGLSVGGSLDTDGLLDFIKDLPDINPVSAAAGGMFKSRSATNLSTLGSLWDEEEDAALAGLEFSRPKKMSRSASMNQLAPLGGADAGKGALPPHLRASPPRGSPSHSGSDSGGGPRLGPLGKPIRRTNTFTASLAPLEERETEERLAPAPAPAGAGVHHSLSGEDLVQQLLGEDPSALQPQQALGGLDDPLQVFQEL